MKRILALTLCIAMMLLSFASCKKIVEEGDVTVVVENGEGKYEVYKTYLENVKNKTEGAFGVLENLQEREDDPLHLVCENGTYGAFIKEIGSIKENASEGAYIMIYTSVASDSYADAPTVTYGDALLYSAGVGANMLTVEAGTILLFRLEVYSA